MLARWARTRPCLARFWRSSLARSTRMLAPSILIVMPSGTGFDSSPFGPFTLTLPAFWVSVTPLGMGSGFLPIRDMATDSLPDFAEKLAAQARLPRRAIGHETFRRR